MNRLDAFVERVRNYASQPCIEGEGFAFTYADLLEQVEHWQSRFDEVIVRPGSVVGVRAEYSLAAVAVLIALLVRRAIVALIPRDREAAHYLSDAHAMAVLTLGAEGSHSWHRVEHSTSHPLLDRLRAADEGGMIIFTSGSTGRPKAALQSAERFFYKFQRRGRCLRTLAFLRFDHIAGLDTLFYTLSNGGVVIVTEQRDPESIMSLIEAHRVEVLPTSPSFLRLLCAAKDMSHRDLSSLRIITYGSEPMDQSTLSRLNARFPSARICQKYGTTETGSPRTVSLANDSLWLKINSDDVETKVVDDLLWVRSEGTILGYLNAPSPLDEQGWYCTGDLVEVDGPWIRFRGRAADTINVGGEKVAPTEVEQSILELDFVSDAVVSGEPHALMGQVVTARVVLAAVDLDPKEALHRIRLHCRERLASYKVPVRIKLVTGSFANDRQKVQRKLS